mmetsp:Transcript_130725/g.378219  ORF Transcript_130725/g.378219 Transcript_130725/m.378219 type:complete len:268 (+) Transcript_130725:328-1131(+)
MSLAFPEGGVKLRSMRSMWSAAWKKAPRTIWAPLPVAASRLRPLGGGAAHALSTAARAATSRSSGASAMRPACATGVAASTSGSSARGGLRRRLRCRRLRLRPRQGPARRSRCCTTRQARPRASSSCSMASGPARVAGVAVASTSRPRRRTRTKRPSAPTPRRAASSRPGSTWGGCRISRGVATPASVQRSWRRRASTRSPSTQAMAPSTLSTMRGASSPWCGTSEGRSGGRGVAASRSGGGDAAAPGWSRRHSQGSGARADGHTSH